MSDVIKVLDASGVKALFDLLSLQDYPNNDVLMAVINAIDETKADKNDVYLDVVNNKIHITEEWHELNYYDYKNTNFRFIPGQYYTVIWDSVEYPNLLCENWEDEYYGIGDIWGNSGNLPFGMVTSTGRENRLSIYVYEDRDNLNTTHYFQIIPLDTQTINHISDSTVHLTDEERAIWNAKMNGDKIFIGTKAEYNVAYVAGNVPVGALVVLTDVD